MRPYEASLLSTGLMLTALVAIILLPESPLDAGAGLLFIVVSPLPRSLAALLGVGEHPGSSSSNRPSPR
jgi:hypothetical protein